MASQKTLWRRSRADTVTQRARSRILVALSDETHVETIIYRLVNLSDQRDGIQLIFPHEKIVIGHGHDFLRLRFYRHAASPGRYSGCNSSNGLEQLE